MSPLLFREVLGVFLNILTPDGKYRGQDWENLLLPIQMQLSEKGKKIDKFFVLFLESTSNFKDFEKKMLVIPMYFPNYRLSKSS